MTKLSEPKLEMLRIIAKHNGDWNWYQVSRAAFDIMTEHPDIKLSEFVSAGLVIERFVEGEPLAKLSLTQKGRDALK